MKTSRQVGRFGILILIAIAVFSTPILIWHLTRAPSTMQLPAPDLVGYLPLSDALGIDVVDDSFEGQALNLTDVSQLLWSMQGMTSAAGFRVAPSAGGTYPLEVFVAVNRVSDLETGFYRYNPNGHSLTEVSINESADLTDCFAVDDRVVLEEASVVLAVFAEYARTTQRYGARGIQYVHLEVGHVLQNAFLQMAALDLRTKPILNLDEGMLQGFMNTAYHPLLVLPVGRSWTLGPLRNVPMDGTEMTVEQAINSRRSVRDYLNHSFPNEKLLEILNSCALAPLIGGNASHYSLRLVLRDVTLLDTGLHEFSLTNGTLTMLSDENLVESIFEAGLSQPWIREAQVNLVISAEFGWTRQLHDADFQWRMMLYNIGMLSQIVYLKCASMGLGTVAVGGLYEDQVAQVVQVPEGFTSVYIMPIGVL